MARSRLLRGIPKPHPNLDKNKKILKKTAGPKDKEKFKSP
uniref:Uncharacterized protein n=1 Tax=Anguilla anguilla TaxID=7936 RepID=A0A0E9T6L8_ANGAN